MSQSLKALHIRVVSSLTGHLPVSSEEPEVIAAEEGNVNSPANFKNFFLLAVLVSIALIGFFVAIFLKFSRQPVEDAAILMRYSLHLSQGDGIVWNIGAKPVDGGTDFLFLVVLSVLVKAGLAVEIAARLVGILSHLLTAILVYLAITRLHGASRWVALLSATYLAIGPGLGYIAADFGTTFFALFACITWYIATRIVKGANSNATSLLFAFSGLIMGLIRPEGVFLAVFILLALLYMKGIKNSLTLIAHFIIVFLLIGGTYFLWRWHYFGYPLPNPFYKKGGGQLYLSSLIDSVITVIRFCGPFSLAFLIGLRTAASRKQTLFLLIPTVGFTLIWVFLSNEMNYLGRFQYAVLPLVLMSWPVLVKGAWKELELPQLKVLDRRGKLAIISVVACFCVIIAGYQYLLDAKGTYYRDGRYDVALMLKSYSQKNYTMATTESGLLPFYSDWRDVDTWGLNDQWIAHHGIVTESYLDAYKPEVIMIHAFYSPLAPPDYNNSQSAPAGWSAMVMVLQNYAVTHGYILAAAFGISPQEAHYYYVRPDFPDSGAIVKKIQNITYYWYATGQRCTNYALVHPT